MQSQDIIMKLRYSGLAFLLLFSLLTGMAYAQENGKIYHLSYNPSEPVALEDLTFSIGVENPSDKIQSYSMQFQIVKQGKVVNEQEFTFTLEKSKGIFFTPSYSPQDIGEFEIIVKLYDKPKYELFDTKFIKFNVVSYLGPFDIIIDPLTTRVRPGLFLPAKLFLENVGSKGTDVEVRIIVNCPDKNLTQSLTVFLPANNRTERLVSIQTCEQEGLYEILASILVFNKTWVSSVSQFFVNASFIQLQFEVPEKIVLKAGESYTFPVEVTNLGNQKITDLKFIVQRIPLAWQKSSPSSIIEVNPNEKVVFIVNITVPSDAESKSYEVRMTAAAEEVLERQISFLEVTPLAVLPTGVPLKEIPIFRYVIISLIVLVGIILLGFLLKHLKRKQKAINFIPERLETLKKIKEKLGK